jgi:myo-inositol-1-phosphate synthase
MLVNLFRERGVRVDRTYQLNFGGNTDFLNMLERERLESKKISKTQSVTSQLDIPLPADDVHVGPSDHVPWLTDRKWAYIRLEGTTSAACRSMPNSSLRCGTPPRFPNTGPASNYSSASE